MSDTHLVYKLRASEHTIYFVVVPLLVAATISLAWLSPLTLVSRIGVSVIAVLGAAYTTIAYWLRTRRQWVGLRYTTPIVSIGLIIIGLLIIGNQARLSFLLLFPVVIVSSVRYGRWTGVGAAVFAAVGYSLTVLISDAPIITLLESAFIAANLVAVGLLSGAMADEERGRREAAQQQRLYQQRALLDLANTLAASELPDTLSKTAQIAQQLLFADGAAVMALIDDKFRVLGSSGLLALETGNAIERHQPSIVMAAAHSLRAVAIANSDDPLAMPLWNSGIVKLLRAGLAIPMLHSSQPRGVFVVFSGNPRLFNDDEVHLLTLIASQTMVALERGRAEMALRASEAHFRTLVNSMDDAVFTINPDLRVAGVFGHWLDHIDKPADMLVGRRVSEIFDPQIGDLHETAFRRAFNNETLSYEWASRNASGLSYYQTSLSPMRNASGAVTGVVGVSRNITAQRRAEEELRREMHRAATLARVASRLNAELSLDTVLDVVCTETARALDVNFSTISLYDAERDALVFAHGLGVPAEFITQVEPLPRAAYENATKSNPVNITTDVQALANLPNASLYKTLNVRTTVEVSLRRDGMLVGRLNIGTIATPRSFSPDEISLLQGLADQAAQAITNARLYEAESHQRELAEAIRESTAALNSTLNVDEVLDRILTSVGRVVPHDSASIMLIGEGVARIARRKGFVENGLEEKVLKVRFNVDEVACLSQMARSGKPILVDDTHLFEGWVDLAETRWVRSYAGAPIIRKGAVIGFVNLNSADVGFFTAGHAALLQTFADQAGIAIENAQLFNDLQLSNADLALAYLSTLEGWSRALELRDQETEGHTQRVTELTVQLARRFQLPDDEIKHIYRGALMHDIGKMGIPDSILLKPGALNDEERAIMQRHPGYAYEMLSPVEYLRPALDIPYGHHEKWDGTGYPRGLKGDDIPLAARIFAIADVWDALCSDRPYRKGWPEERVIEHIKSLSGTHFDPKVVEVFLDLKGRR